MEWKIFGEGSEKRCRLNETIQECVHGQESPFLRRGDCFAGLGDWHEAKSEEKKELIQNTRDE